MRDVLAADVRVRDGRDGSGPVSRPPSQAVIEAVEQAFRVHVVQGLGWKCTCGVNVEDFAGYERHSYTEVARAAEQAADEKWMRWLIEQLHYGIDTSCEVDPPCTLADYAAMWERIDPREKHMAEVIVAETGAWADELTDTDDRSMS